MLIDCGTCVGRGLACDDCVVNVVLSRPAADLKRRGPGPMELDDAERDAFATLAEAGLVPPLRLVPVVHFTPGEAGPSRDIA